MAPYPAISTPVQACCGVADGYQPTASLSIIDTSQVFFTDEEPALAELCDAVVLWTDEPEIRIGGPETDVFRFHRDGYLDRTYNGRQASERVV
jgi:hypothetical protein